MYWTDLGSRPAVERSGLNRDMREVVVSTGLVSPSGLAVDHGSQRLYWCDMSRGVIESANLDGSNRHMLSKNQVGESPLPNTHTSTTQTNTVYTVYAWNTNYTLWQIIFMLVYEKKTVGRPFDVAVFENMLWVSDWESHFLYRLNMTTGRNPEHLRDIFIQPAALVVVHPLAKPGMDTLSY